jgi:hypothetical protein
MFATAERVIERGGGGESKELAEKRESAVPLY